MKSEDDLKKEVTMDVLETLKGKISHFSHDAQDYAKDLCDKTGSTIKANPWKAVGIAAGVGLLFGLLIKR
jgi:ElaB/YqjD/DUF883 family membrane-anchored ribosome-binding protein